MFKQHLLFNLEREIQLLKQLAPLIEEKDLHFRPVENVRSTLEVMQYLSSIGSAMMRMFTKNDLNREEWMKIREYGQTLTLQNFHERLDEQLADIKMYMNMISDQDLDTKEVELPSKEKMLLGSAIINAPIKWMAAYRMELFVYLKINSGHKISTKEAWTIVKD